MPALLIRYSVADHIEQMKDVYAAWLGHTANTPL